ncbi:MAG: hypothetical protein CMJ46_02555 [Planctomyces sp.]|nr:hypothetical protein [Planctomyces sp.]
MNTTELPALPSPQNGFVFGWKHGQKDQTLPIRHVLCSIAFCEIIHIRQIAYGVMGALHNLIRTVFILM